MNDTLITPIILSKVVEACSGKMLEKIQNMEDFPKPYCDVDWAEMEIESESDDFIMTVRIRPKSSGTPMKWVAKI